MGVENEVTVIRRTIGIDGNAKTKIRWFVEVKSRIPRKKKKWLKKQYGPYWTKWL